MEQNLKVHWYTFGFHLTTFKELFVKFGCSIKDQESQLLEEENALPFFNYISL